MKLSNLIKTSKAKGISCNSKTVGKDFIFVAIKGNRDDGNKFIAEAIERGAKIIITDTLAIKNRDVKFIKVKDTRKALGELAAEFYRHPSDKIRVVGVTGTNGKTTITYLIEALVKEINKTPAVLGTINYRFKDQVIPSKNTTPGPVDLQMMLSGMLKAGVSYAAMEVSSHALDQDRTEGIKFSSAIFTNLTQDHLDYHKSLNNYFLAKAKLFKNLSPRAFAVLNSDDKYTGRLRKITRAKVITYGIEKKADIAAKQIKFSPHCTEFLLTGPKIEIPVKTTLIGKHNVYNILAAAAWAVKEGISPALIKSAIEKFRLVPGRLEPVEAGNNFSVFVDYAHTEDALKNILMSLRQISDKKIITVFGCGGDRDKLKRPLMGKVVTELSDYAIITSDNPRSEDPGDIIKDIRRGISKDNFCVVEDRLEAIKKSLSLASAGDIVLLAGKGHENYQIIKDKILPFDDREVAKTCLK